MNNLQKTMIVLIMIVSLILSLVIAGIFLSKLNELQELKKKCVVSKKTQLCEDYANQKVTSSRVHIDGGEREYAINGIWVKESELIESCEGKYDTNDIR